mmetsp:Transcript_11415/g.21982  ORF Transcript_11415/g.21982 Transcript_11415/m.21982 type:complete len:109 (-) Transcript_11415:1266-1592(-)
MFLKFDTQKTKDTMQSIIHGGWACPLHLFDLLPSILSRLLSSVPSTNKTGVEAKRRDRAERKRERRQLDPGPFMPNQRIKKGRRSKKSIERREELSTEPLPKQRKPST